MSAQAGESPVLTVTRGSATPAEIAVITAVLLAVLAAAASTPPTRPAPTRAGWAARSRALTVFPHSGPGGWRASGRPH